MVLRKISSEAEHQWALTRIDELMDISEDDPRFYELIYLSDIVADYEDVLYPPAEATPAEIILFMMDQHDISRKDLEPILGGKSMVSMILKGERNLTIDKLSDHSHFLNVPVELLVPKPKTNVIPLARAELSQVNDADKDYGALPSKPPIVTSEK
jgi:HTH-type transcriptional regulator/antitoxin HigA